MPGVSNPPNLKARAQSINSDRARRRCSPSTFATSGRRDPLSWSDTSRCVRLEPLRGANAPMLESCAFSVWVVAKHLDSFASSPSECVIYIFEGP